MLQNMVKTLYEHRKKRAFVTIANKQKLRENHEKKTGTIREYTGTKKGKASNLLKILAFFIYGGEGEIRTHGTCVHTRSRRAP